MGQRLIEDVSCSAFSQVDAPEQPSLLRFVVGEDTVPRPFTPEEMTIELGDPFAALLLAKGVFPVTADELLAAIDDATSPEDPLRAQRSFMVGEDGQLGLQASDIDSTNSSIRFLVARGSAPHGPEIVISASHPQTGLVELMAWDQVHLGFNYYRTVGGAGGWVWAGNSRHALKEPTRGKGPFESHPSGNLIMKELRLPWVHWDSFKAHIPRQVFPEGDVRLTHPWLTQLQGAETCETAVVMPSIVRWTNARFEMVAAGTTPLDHFRLIEHIATSPTVNLASSSTESAAAKLGSSIDLPPSFFVDAEALQALGLPTPPAFAVESQLYLSSLETFGFRLTDGAFSRPGDTHFAFLVPERAFEDNEVLRQALVRGHITPRLAAAILMVDFPNPVFSRRRSQLMTSIPTMLSTTDGDVSERIAGGILSASEQTAEDSPERDFAARWNLGEGAWKESFTRELDEYYSAIASQLGSQEGFNNFVRLAESRRNSVRDLPIGSEFRLLLPETDLDDAVLVMTESATVTEDLP